MEYVVYRRFKAEGIDGAFNLRYGTTVTERDVLPRSFPHRPDGERNGYGGIRRRIREKDYQL